MVSISRAMLSYSIVYVLTYFRLLISFLKRVYNVWSMHPTRVTS